MAHVEENGITGALPARAWWDINDYGFSHKLRKYELRITDFILAVGLILNVARINIKCDYIIVFTFIVNTILASIYTFEYTRRYGVDYEAYL